MFFDIVHQVDSDLAVPFLLGDMRKAFPPGLESRPGALQVGGKSSGTVPGPARPGSRHCLSKPGAMDPIIFKTENTCMGNGGGDIDIKRDMVRGRPGEGG